jgi:hypothetical protein
MDGGDRPFASARLSSAKAVGAPRPARLIFEADQTSNLSFRSFTGNDVGATESNLERWQV